MRAEFNAGIFQRRREELMRRMQPGLAIFASAPVYPRNGDVSHSYRQDSDFFYLTGFEEPGSLALLRPQAEQRFVLFVPERNKEMEIWNGRRAGPEGARSKYGADEAHTLEEIDGKVPEYLRDIVRMYVHLGGNESFDQRVMGWLNKVRAMKRQGFNAPTEMHDPSEIVHEMRVLKTDDDLGYLREACRISAEAHVRAMKSTRPGLNEFEIEAEISYYCARNGAARMGYTSIVAGGDNANILHYVQNDMGLADGDLLLVDAGCEYGMYTADITRTWPVSGKFSQPQREVYDCVLRAQLAGIEKCRDGVSFREVHNVAVVVLTRGMVEMGLLEGDPAEIIAVQASWDEDVKAKKVDPKKDKAPRTYREFYMHNTSHWLGMDVHDVGKYKNGDEWLPLRAGCVLTVEPGIYISAERDDVPEKYRGIGIRIEDDVLVTNGDPEVLTAGAPKEAAEIEKLMAG